MYGGKNKNINGTTGHPFAVCPEQRHSTEIIFV